MRPRKFRKKPVIIEAMQFTGNNWQKIQEWMYSNGSKAFKTVEVDESGAVIGVIIRTLEGEMVASIGDYIIKGVKGEFYPCKPDIFERTYEEVKVDDFGEQ